MLAYSETNNKIVKLFVFSSLKFVSFIFLLVSLATSSIAAQSDSRSIQVTGPKESACENKPVWCSYQVLFQQADNKLKIKTDKDIYSEGSTISISLSIPEDGYLYLFSINADDQMQTLYPNKFFNETSADVNWHRKGEINLGKRCKHGQTCLGFSFVAVSPLGKSLIITLVTKEPLSESTLARISETRLLKNNNGFNDAGKANYWIGLHEISVTQVNQ